MLVSAGIWEYIGKGSEQGLPVGRALERLRCSRLVCHPFPWVASTLQHAHQLSTANGALCV